MRKIILTFVLILTGCATQNAMPLGGNKVQIDVSGSYMTRADIQRVAFKEAAQATVKAGYDRFMVLETKSWTEEESFGSSYGSLDGNILDVDGQEFGFESTDRMPEATMIIKMLRKGDPKYSDAIDAKQFISTQQN